MHMKLAMHAWKNLLKTFDTITKMKVVWLKDPNVAIKSDHATFAQLNVDTAKGRY